MISQMNYNPTAQYWKSKKETDRKIENRVEIFDNAIYAYCAPYGQHFKTGILEDSIEWVQKVSEKLQELKQLSEFFKLFATLAVKRAWGKRNNNSYVRTKNSTEKKIKRLEGELKSMSDDLVSANMTPKLDKVQLTGELAELDHDDVEEEDNRW